MDKNKNKYQEEERVKAAQRDVFNGDKFGEAFMGKERPFVLSDWKNNFYPAILPEVLEYFRENDISWWGGSHPTGHILSSQIACINHLFAIRNNKAEVLKMAQIISPDLVDVLKIETDKYSPAYIQFEAVSDTDHLNEKNSTRGSNCTSVDALMYARHKNGQNIIIPIEWKYTEWYDNTDKSTESGKGDVRLKRYSDLIDKSHQLKKFSDYKGSVYFFEPFYQLMRQTLWAEQMIEHKSKETVKADDFIHVHVIPQENKDLLEKSYKCSGKNMEDTWRDCLIDQNKYKIITPENLIGDVNDKELVTYLAKRYGYKEL